MAQSPLVSDHVPLPTHGPVGDGVEHGVMHLEVAGSIPAEFMVI